MLINWSNGKVLDVAGGADVDKAPLTVVEPTGAASQKWRLEPIDGVDDAVFVQSTLMNGRALDLAHSSHDDGAPVLLYRRHGEPNQRWRVLAYDDGTCQIQSHLTEKVLDLDDRGTVVQWGQADAASAPGQYWFLIQIEE